MALDVLPIEMSPGPGLEVRLLDDPARLLGHLRGRLWEPAKGQPGPRITRFTGEIAEDTLGASMGCTQPDTMIATVEIRTLARVDTAYHGDPATTHPYPSYGVRDAKPDSMSILPAPGVVLYRAGWRFVPVTMAHFEMMFDRRDFVPAEVERVTTLSWEVVDETPKRSRYESVLIPGPKADLKAAVLDQVSRDLRPEAKIDWGALTNATTTTIEPKEPVLTPEILADMRRQIERSKEESFLSLYPPTFVPEPLPAPKGRGAWQWFTKLAG